MTFKLMLKFPTSYPYEAPQVTFSTPCFHPNVDQYGNICLDILKEKWSAVYNVRTILLSIQSLLGGTRHFLFFVFIFDQGLRVHALLADPNLDSPLNGHAASIWNNVDEYKKALTKHTAAHSDRR